MLAIRTITDAAEWNRAVLERPDPHILQSWHWGEFKSKYGWSPTRLLFCNDRAAVAAAQILRRPVPRTPFGVMYVPKGPLLDYRDPNLLDSALASVERWAREHRAIFVKIDPDIQGIDRQLLTRRWRPSSEQIQFRNTVLLDLTPSEDELLASMKAKTRYNIRLAAKRGVRVQVGMADDTRLFYEMYAETSKRDGFLIRPFSYYRDAWQAFIDSGQAYVLFARLGEETIAGLILYVFGDHAWYFYGASRNDHRETMPNYLLQWEAIRLAKALGCRVYDFWGAPDALVETSPMYGVYRFKEGFGGKFTPHVGAYDYVVNPALYFLYSVVRPRYLARLRAKRAPSAFEG